MSRFRVVAALVAAGCSAPAELRVVATQPPPTSSSAAPIRPDPCTDLAERARAASRAAGPWCARALIAKARAKCPEETALAADARAVEARLREDEAKIARDHVVSGDGRWLIERRVASPNGPDETRIWQLLPDGAELVALAHPRGCSVVEGPGVEADLRLFCGRSQIVDPARGELRSFADVEEATRNGRHIALVGAGRAVLLDAATIDPEAEITSPEIAPFPPPVLLAGGRSILAGALVSFASRAVVAGPLERSSASRDGSRVIGCAPDTPEIVVVDAASGQELTRAAGPAPSFCRSVVPVLSGDGRYAFGAEEKSGPSSTTLTPVVLDVAKGGATRLEAAAHTIRREGVLELALEPPADDGRLCVSFEALLAGHHRGWFRECPWTIDSSGHVQRAPLVDPFDRAALGIGRDEAARATSPDGSQLAIAAYDTKKPSTIDGGEGANLRLVVLEVATRRALRTIDAIPGRFPLPPTDAESGFGFGWVETSRLVFLGPSHLVLTPGTRAARVGYVGANGQGYLGNLLTFDLATGTKTELDADYLGGVWALASDGAVLVDLTTMKRVALTPDETAWQAVKSLGSDCPEL